MQHQPHHVKLHANEKLRKKETPCQNMHHLNQNVHREGKQNPSPAIRILDPNS